MKISKRVLRPKENGKVLRNKLLKLIYPAKLKMVWTKANTPTGKQNPFISSSFRRIISPNIAIQVAKSDIQKKNLLFGSDGRLLKDNITL